MAQPTREPVLPRARRRSIDTGARNRVYVCEPCNLDKGDRTLIEFLAALIAAGDVRAQYVAAVVQGLCARGLGYLCG